jgi:hypothetical protein
MSESSLRKWLKGKSFVVVEWLDACSRDGWHGAGDTLSAQKCVTCGILQQADDTSVTVTHTYGMDDGDGEDACCSIAIPKGCIVSLYTIPCLERHIKVPGGRKK